jgi:DNA-binding MarR family transcriptional regulator
VDEQGPRTIGELAVVMQVSQPAITRSVARLVEAGLVEIERSEADRRRKVVALSAAGRQLLERSRREVWPLVEVAVKAVVDDLSGPLLKQVGEIEARLAACPLSRRVAAAAAPQLARATEADLPEVEALMNLAYRGQDAGWTSEADCIGGSRTNEAMLRDDIARDPNAALLIWRHSDGNLIGCVWLEPEGGDVWYLGSLTVEPRRQNAGLGRRLLAAAEDWIRQRGGREVRMTVVNVRDTLIDWYGRRGYQPTGETKPFPYGDHRFGVPKRGDLHFVVLRKRLYDSIP